jgi:hypothetical protein
MNCIGEKISKKSAWELAYFYSIRRFSDGITWFEFVISSDYFKADHNPQFSIRLVMFNFIIFEFNIYNIEHIDKGVL